MKSTIHFKALTLCFIGLCASSAEAQKSVEDYRSKTESGLWTCLFVYRGEMAGAPPAKDPQLQTFSACSEHYKELAGASLKNALADVKRPKAKAALKMAHVAFVTAIDGTAATAGERAISYEQRQSRLREEITKAWATYEVEK
jgi:hypothetical protein